MSVPNQYFCETHIIGDSCRQNQLDCEYYPVLREAPFRWLGYSELCAPYRMVRMESVHSHIVACLEGKGRTWIDGQLVEFGPGKVLLAPVGQHHAFEAVEGQPWTIAWVFYDDSEQKPVLKDRKASLISAETDAFAQILNLLLKEAAGANQADAMSALVTLLDVNTKRMVGIEAIDDRLWKLWLKVDGTLAYDWSVGELASFANVSEEHLRRLCHKYHQRSPMEHLTQLRMRRAATLLRSTDQKVEDISISVGYASMYSFSVAFKRWSGVPPRNFRAVG